MEVERKHVWGTMNCVLFRLMLLRLTETIQSLDPTMLTNAFPDLFRSALHPSSNYFVRMRIYWVAYYLGT